LGIDWMMRLLTSGANLNVHEKSARSRLYLN